MRLEQLEYLIAINDYKSMHAASRKLCVSQQCISKAMQDLESELNIKLFVRSSTGTSLTKEGRDIYFHAVNIMEEVGILRGKYASFQKTTSPVRELKFYISNSIGHFIVDYLSAFNLKYNTVINIVEEDTHEILNQIENKEAGVEIAFIQYQLNELEKRDFIKNEYACYLIKTERLGVLMNRASNYSQSSSISLKRLTQLPLLANTSSIDNAPVLIKLLQDMNITLNIRYITRARSSEKYLQNNTAYALGTQTVLEIFENDNIVFVPLKEKIYIAIYLLVHKTNLSDTARIFVNDFLEKYTPEKLFD